MRVVAKPTDSHSITGSHALFDGRGAFLILNELVRSLHEPARDAESYTWVDAESRLTVNNALLAGVRRIGEPPSASALAFRRQRTAKQVPRADQVLLPTLPTGRADAGLRSIARSLDRAASAELFAAAKSHGTTVTAVSS